MTPWIFGLDPLLDNYGLGPIKGGTLRIDGVTWSVEEREYRRCYDPDQGGWYQERAGDARILRNGRVAMRTTSGEQCSFYLPKTPAPFNVVALRENTWMGSGEETTFYGIRRRKLVRMAYIAWGTAGGPIFRDLDHDGKPEWIWDDNSWYTYYGAPPLFWIAFKLGPDGRLHRWRKFRNPTHRGLPRRF